MVSGVLLASRENGEVQQADHAALILDTCRHYTSWFTYNVSSDPTTTQPIFDLGE